MHLRITILAASLLVLTTGCEDQFGLSLGDESAGAGSSAAALPPGATCANVSDCSADQVCVGQICRPQRTSVAGEILAAVATEQLESGETGTALATFQEALTAFEEAGAPVPPGVLCGAANATLRSASDAQTREIGARLADGCFRNSLPGHPARAPVNETLAGMRYDGLWLAAFDAAEPEERYFTAQPSRPSADSVQVDMAIPENDGPGYEEATARFRSAEVARAIAECFISDWEQRHESSASAVLNLSYRSRMRDMGDYDAYFGQVELEGGGSGTFEACVIGTVSASFTGEPTRARRSGSWEETVRITARLNR